MKSLIYLINKRKRLYSNLEILYSNYLNFILIRLDYSLRKIRYFKLKPIYSIIYY